MRWRQLQTAQPHINLPSLVHCPDLAGLAETEADQPGPAQLVGVQSAPLPSPGLEVNTPALCQHPQVARHHGDLVQLLARGRGHCYQGLPADIQLEERLSPACQLEQEVARVGLLPSPAWSLAWPDWSLEQTREEMSSLDQRKVETGWRVHYWWPTVCWPGGGRGGREEDRGWREERGGEVRN